jgi:hypothetical protein
LFSSSAIIAQEASSAKKLYKIDPAANSFRQVKESELPKDKYCVYSCETNTKTNQAIITTVDEKGIVKKETYDLKTDKK